MNDGLRDIASIEPSYFILYICIFTIIILALLFYLYKKYFYKRNNKCDFNKEWEKILKSYHILKVYNNYKKFYYALNQAFKKFIAMYLDKNIMGMTLNEILEILKLNDEDRERLIISLERIYRGDYYFLSSEGKKMMQHDFETIDTIVKKLIKEKDFEK